MLASLVTGIGGFATIFIGMRDNAIPGLLGFECVSTSIHVYTHYEKSHEAL